LSTRPRGLRSKLLLSAGAALAALALLEALLRATDLDFKIAGPLLYYQGVLTGIQRASDDAELMYELRPGAAEEPVRGLKFTVDEHGFRASPHRREKAPGVFRVFCFGGSNTFGASVTDHETYPAFLEKELSARLSRPVEVWNAGVAAYELRQNVRSAERVALEFEPDLLIFEHHNRFRRPFLLGAPVGPLFKRDPTLYRENLPFLPFAGGELRLMNWALWRALVFALNRGGAPPNHHHDPDAEHMARFREFLARHPELPVLAFAPLDGIPPYDFGSLGVPFLPLSARRPRDAGPELADEIFRRGLAPA
jgi:hypothetical protein